MRVPLYGGGHCAHVEATWSFSSPSRDQSLSPTDAMDALRSLATVLPAQTCARCGLRRSTLRASLSTHSHQSQTRRSATLRRARFSTAAWARRLCVAQSSSGGGDFDASRSSDFFESSIVQQESTTLFRSFQQLSAMQTRYFSFDSEGAFSSADGPTPTHGTPCRRALTSPSASRQASVPGRDGQVCGEAQDLHDALLPVR
jgi:hypothetical protein